MPTVTTKHRLRWVNPEDSEEHLFDIEEVRPMRPPHYVRAGELRDRVEIQSLTETVDAHGGVTKSFATTDTVWARVRFLTGREFFQAEQVQSDANVEVKIRHKTLMCRERKQDGWRG